MLAIIFSIFCLFLAVRQKLQVDSYKDELGLILKEASAVRDELETIMSSTVELSRSVADNIDNRINEYRMTIEQPGSKAGHHHVQTAMEASSTTSHLSPGRRIYEIARDHSMSSKDLLNILRSQGIKAKNHLCMVEPDLAAAAIRDFEKVKGVQETERAAEPLVLQAVQQTDNRPGNDADKLQQASPAESVPAFPSSAAAVEGAIYEAGKMDFSIDDLRQAHPYIAVRTLHEKGFAVREIARLLERGQGEIQLILNLTGRKQAQSL